MNYSLRFTLDYEIHGNGDGNPLNLMVEPTGRLMSLLENYSQRLTIMADVAEILSFKRFFHETGNDTFHVTEIEAQLKDAIRRGHDVQLHIHSSWFHAEWNGRKWEQCMSEYNMAALPKEKIDDMVRQCVNYLTKLLSPIKPDYKVWLFRAANWSMMPTKNIYEVLLKYGIQADSSVYKGGVQGGIVAYDYREAYHNLLSYPADETNINLPAPPDQKFFLTEYPIYTEMRRFWDFLSPIRTYRLIRSRFHRFNSNAFARTKSDIDKADNKHLGIKSIFRRSPWKLDFNQATGEQLIAAFKRIKAGIINDRDTVDVVLIGHSKSFIPYNRCTLEKFLSWVSKDPHVLKY